MANKSYSVLWKQVGLHGEAQMTVRVLNVSNGDYILVGGDLTKITQAAFIGITGQAPLLVSIASTNWPGTAACLTITSYTTPAPAASFAADDCDILLYGPAATNP